jgi:hypothetical protein
VIGGSRASYWQLAIVATGILAGLKLSGYLGWPWLGVTAPLWVPLLLSVGLRLAALALILGALLLVDPGGVVGEIEALAVEVGSWLGW